MIVTSVPLETVNSESTSMPTLAEKMSKKPASRLADVEMPVVWLDSSLMVNLLPAGRRPVTWKLSRSTLWDSTTRVKSSS